MVITYVLCSEIRTSSILNKKRRALMPGVFRDLSQVCYVLFKTLAKQRPGTSS